MSMEEQLRFCCMEYEKKLKELMGEEEFQKYSMDVARRGFLKEVLGMASGDFKDFCLENFRKITGMEDFDE